MNLQFTNKGGNFVSEFEVTSDFNLHIEGVRLSDMHIYQKTAGGSYAKVTDFPSERSQDRVADFDFASLVYPKFIKVVCATEPTYAEIATDGEVTEIKSQSKEVEITSNGVTEIAPDAGFGYLSGVKVNVNVPQSGGDAPSGGSDAEYIVTEELNTELGPTMAALSISTKYKLEQGGVEATLITSSLLWAQYGRPKCKAIKFSKKEKFATIMGVNGNTPIIQVMSALETLNLAFGGDVESLIDSLPRITEEEFYAI